MKPLLLAGRISKSKKGERERFGCCVVLYISSLCCSLSVFMMMMKCVGLVWGLCDQQASKEAASSWLGLLMVMLSLQPCFLDFDQGLESNIFFEDEYIMLPC